MSLSVWRIKFGNLDQRNGQHLHVNYSILYPFQSHLEQACRSSIPPVKRKVQYFSKSRYCYIILFQIIILFQVAIFFHNTFPCHLETWMLPCLKRPSSAARTTSNTWKTIFVFLLQTSYQKFYRGQISSSLSQPPDMLIEIKNDLDRESYQEYVTVKKLRKYIFFWQKTTTVEVMIVWWSSHKDISCLVTRWTVDIADFQKIFSFL